MNSIENIADNAKTIAARTALVLETNNLRGGGRLDQALASLKALVAKLSQQSLPPAALAQWIITHDGFDDAACAEIVQLAGCPIEFVAIDPKHSYYEAKNLGFEQVDPQRCDYVAFCDADCTPASQWLEQLLLPFRHASLPLVVAGRTSYSASVMGVALTSIDFMYFPGPLRHGTTRNFYANNVAFRREVFDQYRYRELDGVYRAHCQVLGLRLQAAGIALHYAGEAHTEHRLPDTRSELLKLRWMRGEDSVSLTPYLVHTYLPRSMHWLGRSGPLGPVCVMGIRLVYSVRMLNRQQLPPLTGLRCPAGLFMLIGLSLLDTAGAFARGVVSMVRSPADRGLEALSYHRH